MDRSYGELPRVDAERKVRGEPLYAADSNLDGMLHAALAVATVAKGKLVSIDAQAARQAPGVRVVLTHEDMSGIKSGGYLLAGGFAFQSLQPMLGDRIAYRGQTIALVVADTYENAREAADQITAVYEEEPHTIRLEDAGEHDVWIQSHQILMPGEIRRDKVAGDADAALAEAEIAVHGVYEGPAQHHNAMEMLSTVAEWSFGNLIVHEGTQNAEAVRHGLAKQLGIKHSQVRVVSPYIGGAFGGRNALQTHTVLAAVAAREVDRPVKLLVERSQTFHNGSFRPATRHEVRLGGTRDGRITAAIHETDSQTSRHDLFPGEHASCTARLHGIPNYRGRERMVRLDTQTPGFMRAPWEHMACFAFESAVDELAVAMDVDPVELRLRNDTDSDPITGKPLSSRHMAECLRRGAELFGWKRRSAEPGSMRAPDGGLIGWGMASGAYPGNRAPSVARLTATDDGRLAVEVGGHEFGQGLRTAIVNALSTRLAIEPDSIDVDIGTTGSAPQHLTAGAWGTASTIPVVLDAAETLETEVRSLGGVGSGTPAEALRAAGRSLLTVEASGKAPGQRNKVLRQMAKGGNVYTGPVYPDFVTFSYIAHFVEVVVEPRLRRVRVPRVVSVADCGRVVSPRTARSQVRGGVVWGIGAALREISEIEAAHGGFLNDNLADYVLPVSADIGEIEVELLDVPDRGLNPSGIKGLGEVANAGIAAAIANAVFHATGRRQRRLPIRLENTL